MSTEFYDAMNRVLESPRYDHFRDGNNEFGERVAGWLEQWLEEWLAEMVLRIDATPAIEPINAPNLGFLTPTFAIIGLIVAVIAAVVLIYTFINARKRKYYDLSDMFEELKKDLTVLDLLQLSDQATDRRFAVRYRYIAVLLHLNEKQVIEIKPSCTNAIILQQLKANAPALLQQFQQTMDTFHLAWFGYKTIDNTLYSQFTTAVSVIIGGGNHA